MVKKSGKNDKHYGRMINLNLWFFSDMKHDYSCAYE